MKNWMPTVAGLLAAIGAGLVAVNEPQLRLPGIILNVIGTAMLGIVAKQYNVHGGTVAQATPPAVQAETVKEGKAMAAAEKKEA